MPKDDLDKLRNSYHIQPSFYGVYLLQSIPKQRSFYVGSTPDPYRRLRQHNGELKNGGAYRTKLAGSRPWRIVSLVYNFHSKVAALQFEHLLQHAHQTRHIHPDRRISINKHNNRSLAHKLGNIRLLLNSNYFSRMKLKVIIFEEEIEKVWLQNKYKIEVPNDLEVTLSGFNELFGKSNWQIDSPMGKCVDMKNYFEESKKIILLQLTKCSICEEGIDYFPEVLSLRNSGDLNEILKNRIIPLLGVCYHCYCISHLTCLAHLFLDEDNVLIPSKGECHKCKRILNWSEISEMATNLREVSLNLYLENDHQPQNPQYSPEQPTQFPSPH